MVPDWLQILSLVSLLLGLLAAVWAYFRYGKRAARRRVMPAMERDEEMPSKKLTPFPMMVAKGTLHCGAGCTQGDIVSHWLAFFVPAVAVWVGWKSVFESKVYADWVLAYVFAFVLGVAFQYFAIVPMRGLSPGRWLVEAVKADALSLTRGRSACMAGWAWRISGSSPC